ncbi:MAG: helix-turn-helix domain-containing protein [Pedobacter sp.]
MHEKSTEEITAETPQKPELGTLLLSRREACGLSLETVAERTHIRRSFLQAFENGDYEQLPAFPYAIGFLRQYATLLGLDADSIVQDYRLAIQPSQDVPHRHKPSEVPPLKTESVRKQRLGRFLWPVIVMVLIGAVWLLFYNMGVGPWSAERNEDIPVVESAANASADETVLEPVSRNDVASPAQTPSLVEPDSATVSPVGDSMPQAIKLPLPSEGGVFRIESKGTGWVEIEADRRPLQNYDMQPGTLVDWTVRNFAEIRLNIQGGAQAWLDDRKLDLPETCMVILGQLAEAKPIEPLATLTAGNHDETSQP